jgi:hypothetical protein
MKYEMAIFKPGLVGFDKKGQPYGFEPEILTFEANSGAHALHIARATYKGTGLGVNGHFNVSKESA